MRNQRTLDVSSRIRELLKLTGLTQRDLAKHLGTTPSHLNLFFTHKADMHSTKLIETLYVLGIDLPQLLAQRVADLNSSQTTGDSSTLLVKLQNIEPFNREPLLKIIKALAV